MNKYRLNFEIHVICEDNDYHAHEETHELICTPETLEHEISKIKVGIRRRLKDEHNHLEVSAKLKDVHPEPEQSRFDKTGGQTTYRLIFQHDEAIFLGD